MEVKDSGKREEFNTGSKRDTREGKGRFDLIPFEVVEMLARHYENGAVKYGDNNWKKGQPISRYMDSAMRHLVKYWCGLVDEDHLISAIWNLFAIADTEERIAIGELPKELDDHPAKNTQAPLFLRILRKIKMPNDLDDCWTWTGANNGTGYGVITAIRGKKIYVHREMCKIVNGESPTKRHIVAHSCDNPSCINPKHLRWVTPRENNQEAIDKGRKKFKSKLSKEDVEDIKSLQDKLSHSEIAEMFDISSGYVSDIINNKKLNSNNILFKIKKAKSNE